MLVICVVRLVLELTERVQYGTTRRRGASASRAMFAVTRHQTSGIESASRLHELDANLASVDIHIDYPVHVPLLPQFIDDNDSRVFIGDVDNRVYFDVPPASQLTGRVRVVRNGVIRPGHECSWKTSDEEFGRSADGERSTTYVNKTLCPLLVPDGHTFQHFVDGVLPKLVQLLTEAPRLASAVDMFVIYRPRDFIIYELLRRVGVSRDRLMLVSRERLQVLETWRLVDTCVTPSLHPRLWRQTLQLLQACQDQRPWHCSHNDDPDAQNRTIDGYVQHHIGSRTTNSSLVVLLSRRWTRNGGRHLLDENAVLDYLVDRFGPQRVLRFGSGRVDLTTASRLFSRAAVVIGVHGGAFYNIILAPLGCRVVEVMPLVAGHGHLVSRSRLAHTVVWRMADALGHTYWRLYASTSSPRSDVTLSVDKLRSALSGVT